jgi:hypothetical protein
MFNGLVQPLQEKMEESLFESFVSEIKLAGDTQYIFGIAEALEEGSILSLENFSFSVSPENVSSAIVADIQAPNLPRHLEKVVSAFLKVPNKISWDPIVESIRGRLQQNAPALNASVALRLLVLLRSLGKSSTSANEARKLIAKDGSLLGVLGIGRKENNQELVGLAIYEAIIQSQNIIGPPEHPQYGSLATTNEFLVKLLSDPSMDQAVVDEIANLALKWGSSARILRLALPADTNRELYRAVFRRMLESPSERTLIVTQMLTTFDRVEEVVGKDLRSNLFNALDNMNIASELTEEKWKTVQPSFLDAAKEARSKQLPAVVQAIRSGLVALSQEQWAAVLNAEGNELALVFKLMKLRELKSLGPMFFDVMRSYGERMVDGTNHPSRFLSEWYELPHQLSHAQRQPFYKSLRDQLVRKVPKPDIIVRVFQAFGEPFAENAAFEDRGGDVIRTIIEPLLADSHDISLVCLEEYSGVFKQTIRRASKEDRQFMTDRLSALSLNADEPRKSRLRGLGVMLDIEISEPSKGDELQEGGKPTQEA